MLWLVKGNISTEIIGCNTHQREETHELWVTKSDGKTMKIAENTDEKEILLIKEAIDYAIEYGEKALRL